MGDVPGWDAIKSEVIDLWSRFVRWERDLATAGREIDNMKYAVNNYPQYLSQRSSSVYALDGKYKELLSKYAETKQNIKKILEYLKIPGLSGLDVGPAIIALGWAAAVAAGAWLLASSIGKLLRDIAVEKSLINKLAPEEVRQEIDKRRGGGGIGGIFGDVKGLVIAAIAAAVLLPMLARK